MMMIRENEWMHLAACRGVSRNIFFPNDYELPDPVALQLCAGCHVRSECLNWALTHDEIGIWGGLTDAGREKITKSLHRVKCPDCRSHNVIENDRCEICGSCGLSWPI